MKAIILGYFRPVIYGPFLCKNRCLKLNEERSGYFTNVLCDSLRPRQTITLAGHPGSSGVQQSWTMIINM